MMIVLTERILVSTSLLNHFLDRMQVYCNLPDLISWSGKSLLVKLAVTILYIFLRVFRGGLLPGGEESLSIVTSAAPVVVSQLLTMGATFCHRQLLVVLFFILTDNCHKNMVTLAVSRQLQACRCNLERKTPSSYFLTRTETWFSNFTVVAPFDSSL